MNDGYILSREEIISIKNAEEWKEYLNKIKDNKEEILHTLRCCWWSIKFMDNLTSEIINYAIKHISISGKQSGRNLRRIKKYIEEINMMDENKLNAINEKLKLHEIKRKEYEELHKNNTAIKQQENNNDAPLKKKRMVFLVKNKKLVQTFN